MNVGRVDGVHSASATPCQFCTLNRLTGVGFVATLNVSQVWQRVLVGMSRHLFFSSEGLLQRRLRAGFS